MVIRRDFGGRLRPWPEREQMPHPERCPQCSCDPYKLQPNSAWRKVLAEKAPIYALADLQNKTFWARCGSLWVPSDLYSLSLLSVDEVMAAARQGPRALQGLIAAMLMKGEKL